MMARRKKNEGNGKKKPAFPGPAVDGGTKRTISGVAFIAAGLTLGFSIFDLAGPGGDILSRGFTWFLGWGYFLLPVALFLLAGVFFSSAHPHVYFSAIVGMLLVFGAILGITDQFHTQAGILGTVAGSISYIFGLWASLVILAAVGVIGIILTFNIGSQRRGREDAQSALALKDSVPVPAPLPPPPAAETPPKEEEPRKAEELDIAPSASKYRHGGRAPEWQSPPLDLLEKDSSKPSAGDIRTNVQIIQRTLENFGIPVEMSEVHVGPTVTQYTLKPAQGVKLSRIVALQNDLSLALAAHPIRVEAPIPGKALVGIEVPNRVPARVRLGSLLELQAFGEARSLLTVPLGRNVMGEAVFVDLARMPHLLVAGATGSGKSIFIHSLILSLLYKNAPETLRFILIDPKRVELSQYHDMPYLLTPAITDGKRAIQALRWAIGEMERRYDLLLGEQARDVFSYNAKFSAQGGSASGGRADASRILPFILVVIDELADLMAAYGREIEGSIVRLAQMARATGIHLVVSTQRPSVEVITGLIKANITSRIAFQVASQVDSRTILDAAGAEKLLGSGDMLYLASDSPKPRRLQSPFVAEDEVKRVRNYILKAAAGAGAPEDALHDLDGNGETLEAELAGADDISIPRPLGSGWRSQSDLATFRNIEHDELYPEAYRVVVESRKASASLLQRRLKIGYARAARLLDILEAKGVIGPGEGAKPRKVYISEEKRSEFQ